ncbi:hypothetical protein Btru_064100 [Bulinus truncatus]|nr:hypothetical protein Btru_064100 [Bulinus truncatus]
MLRANQLTNISADMFEGLENLKILNLSRNSISHIDNDTFDILESLRPLDLSENRLNSLKKDITPRMFENLGLLNQLYLQGNVNSDQPYPTAALSKLRNLTHLYLDLNRNSEFDFMFKSLKMLTSLVLGGPFGYCNIRNITKGFLHHTPYLNTFIMNGCNLYHINPSVYMSVKNLETLEISETSENYNLYKALDHLQGLVNSSLKILRLISVNEYQSLYRSLGKEQAKYLQYIALEELDMSRNRIALICPDFAELLPRTLKRLVLMDNELTIKVFTLDKLFFLTQLSEIHLDGQAHVRQTIQFPRLNRMLKYDESHIEKDVTLNKNALAKWGDRILPNKMQIVDLSDNYAMTLRARFFSLNNSLVSLKVSNNILGECLAADLDGQIFSRATKLKFLDISMNLLTALRRPFFSGLGNLEILLATNNKLQTLNLSLSHMSSLRFMNFSRNSITWIDQSTRDDLDIMASTHTVYLDMSYNPLPCTCEGLPILQWMAYTNVNLVNQVYLRCQSEGGVMSELGHLQEIVTRIQRECASRAVILMISVFFSIFIFMFAALALMYRFRWKIRYMRNIALAKFVGFKPKNIRGDTYQYDAFIVYDDEPLKCILDDFVQELEVKRGHKLFLADRDIMPGTFMTSAIFSTVQNSYRMIPVVTPEFYEGPYSEYAVKMAVMEEIYGQRQVLHLCLYQPTDSEEMSDDLLSIMHRNHYTEYPTEPDRTEDLVEHFWDQLSKCILQKN